MKEILWAPSLDRQRQTNMRRFMEFLNDRYGINMTTYDQVYEWSINKAGEFWAAVWEFGDIRASKMYNQVVTDFDEMLQTRWFVGSELNFAENLLRYRDNHPAIIFKGENLPPVTLTYAEVYHKVARLAKSLRSIGVTKGDRVAGFMPNMPETVIAMLATTSVGAIWSSCSPDFGVNGVIDRFGQIKPKVLFAANGYFYNGKPFDCITKVAGIVSDISSIEKVVIVPYTDESPDISSIPGAILFEEFLAAKDICEIEFTQVPFNHPVYIMYSSGTTGVPKCIVHGGGGALIQHLKELLIHTDLKRKDKIFYFTTCGWMMWNWLVSSLAVGAALVLYDGSPFYPNAGALWKLAEEVGITVFGTSAKYLASVEKEGMRPGDEYNLDSIKTILSTGSPLSEDSFRFVYRHVKRDVCLSSISGGTDIVSCFALGNPLGEVFLGEIQCRGLGMKVECFDQNGKSRQEVKGELVCTAPFPSMPVCFWDDPEKSKFRKAYFDVYPNIWWHGDYIEITATGGVIIYGRSDATLNPGGVRIGTAEIYRQVESLAEIVDSLVIGQKWDNDIRVILFVKLKDGIELTEKLQETIRKTIRYNTTPRHVPAKIIAVKDIPYTLNGKKVEMAVANIVHNEPVLNREAIANPDSLEIYKNLDALQT